MVLVFVNSTLLAVWHTARPNATTRCHSMTSSVKVTNNSSQPEVHCRNVVSAMLCRRKHRVLRFVNSRLLVQTCPATESEHAKSLTRMSVDTDRVRQSLRTTNLHSMNLKAEPRICRWFCRRSARRSRRAAVVLCSVYTALALALARSCQWRVSCCGH